LADNSYMFLFQVFISNIAGPAVMSIFIVSFCVYLYTTGRQKDCDRILFSTCIAMALTYTIKLMTHIPRPLDALVIENDYRFPSGHSTMAAVVSCLVIYYTGVYVKHARLRKLLYVLAVCWFLLIGYSRLYLGAHIPIDVLVGGIIGTLVTMGVIHMFRHLHYYK
jgi:phosphatidylglycerophosphatase B/undecaprenyl-diphosphatase